MKASEIAEVGGKGGREESGKKDGLVQVAWCPENLQTLRYRRGYDNCLSGAIIAIVLFSSPSQALYSLPYNQ